MSRAFELVCTGAVVSSADGFGAGSRERGAQERRHSLCKGLGSLQELAKGQCASVERVEGRVAGNEAGEVAST